MDLNLFNRYSILAKIDLIYIFTNFFNRMMLNNAFPEFFVFFLSPIMPFFNSLYLILLPKLIDFCFILYHNRKVFISNIIRLFMIQIYRFNSAFMNFLNQSYNVKINRQTLCRRCKADS